MGSYLVLLALAGTVALALLAGNYVSRTLRMPESSWKVSLIVLVIGISAVILATSWPPKQGIDLKGGVILIYEIDESLTRQTAQRRQASQGEESMVPDEELGDVDMPGLIQALSRRINPGGVQEIVVRAYGDRQVEIIIPDVSGAEVERIKKLITTGGFLKFQIVANRRDHSHIWSLADQPDQGGQYEVRDESGTVVGQWARLSTAPETEDGDVEYRVDPPQAKSRIVRGRKEVLMVVDPNFSLQGSHLASVRKGYQDVRPAVFFETTIQGAALMGGLTESNQPDPTSGHFSLLGIVMDGELISAPRINSTITRSGLIEGDFTDEEVDLLVNVLRAGRLPAVLHSEPISQNEISPLLGNDTIRQGKFAIGVSLVGVLAFMLIYYRFAGLVACLALALNLMLILAMMIFIGAAFSLPGMAALVLTVGMSVDANVLIFERIREETRNGAALRMAIRNGFGRATRTIVDANLTTIITAIVLYMIGTEQLRAFAVALFLGIVMTLFSAIFFSRVVLDIAERAARLRHLTMMQMFADSNWDLFKKRQLAYVVSLCLIAIGVVAVAARQERIFDIDFLGGTSVQVLLKEQMPIADVRARVQSLQSSGLVQDVSVTEVKSEEHGNQRIYRIDTSLSERDGDGDGVVESASAIARVQQALTEQFRSDGGELLLQTHSMTFTQPTSLALAAGPSLPNDDLPTVDLGDTTGGDAPIDSAPSAEAPDATSTNAEIEPGTEIDGAGTEESAGAAPSDGAEHSLPTDTMLVFAQDTLLAQADTVEPADPTSGPESIADVTPPASTGLDASNLRSQSELEFDEAMNAETLEELVKETAKSLGFGEPDVVLENPRWDGRSSVGYTQWTLKLSSTPERAQQILSNLESTLDVKPVWLSASEIGSSVAGDKTRLAFAAVGISLLGIIAYIWIRFQHVTYGLAAVVALLHDVMITVGAIALSYWLKDVLGFLMIDEFKISLPVVAALLTIIGYSLNDTIVVFDRIREVKGKSPYLTSDIINRSINQTLSRTILTSLTTLIAVVILYTLGGQGIHAFAFALIVGVIVGTYSSIFVASPVLLWMSRRAQAAPAEPQKVTV
jgi:SecD/SecF fusion protein